MSNVIVQLICCYTSCCPDYYSSCPQLHHIKRIRLSTYNLLHQFGIIHFSILKHSINDQPYITNANRYSRRSPVHNLSGETNRLLLGHSSGTPELVSQSPTR